MADTSSHPPPRTRNGCQNCRLRHLKCDEQRPACTRCEKAGIECLRGYNIRFKHGANPSVSSTKGEATTKLDYDFSKTQPWVNTARTLTFLDETKELISIYDHVAAPETSYAAPSSWTKAPPSGLSSTIPSDSGPSSDPSPSNLPLLERANSTGHTSLDDLNSPAKRRRLNVGNSCYPGTPSPGGSKHHVHYSPTSSWHLSPESGSQVGWTPSAIRDIGIDNVTLDATTEAVFADLGHSASLGQQSFTTVSESLSRIYLDTPVWPLQSKDQAFLLRYFVENLARNFDLTDPIKHFRSIVPQRAANCPTLLNAIFSLSARHLSRVGKYDPLISNRYQQECLKYLIPMLDDTTAILDENLLASTIILRHLEEIEVPLSGQSPSDQSSHLFGAHAFIMAQERATVAGGLRHAAFWVGLRQEIYVAFVNQRPIIPLEHCNIDRSLEAAPDHIWSCRMVVLCADVICWCFGSEDHSLAAYSALADQVEQWNNCKPSSFTPIYQQEASVDNIFPELWFVGDEVVVGLQHYHIARILLASYNPGIPRLGPGRAAAIKAMDSEIRDHVRALCGICLSNPSTAASYTYASMGVTMAGDKFTERTEQDALLEVLDICDKKYGWPTGAAQENLKVSWGWREA